MRNTKQKRMKAIRNFVGASLSTKDHPRWKDKKAVETWLKETRDEWPDRWKS